MEVVLYVRKKKKNSKHFSETFWFAKTDDKMIVLLRYTNAVNHNTMDSKFHEIRKNIAYNNIVVRRK